MLNFDIFLKGQKITDINKKKSTQNAYEMYTFVNFKNLKKKVEIKNTYLSKKMSIFGQTYMKFDGCHGNVKNDGHTIDRSTFAENK